MFKIQICKKNDRVIRGIAKLIRDSNGERLQTYVMMMIVYVKYFVCDSFEHNITKLTRNADRSNTLI